MMTLNFQDIDLGDSDQLARIFSSLYVAGIKKVHLQIKSDQDQTQQLLNNLADPSGMYQSDKKRLFSAFSLATAGGLSAIILGFWLWF